MSTNKIKIILADDHSIVRDGIKSLLKTEISLEIIAEAENGEDLLELLKTTEADVIIMDISMPVLNGIEATSRISEEFPEIGVIILSMHEEPEYILKCVEAGASSYLLKNTEKSELVEAINQVSKGKNYFNSNITNLLTAGLTLQKKLKKEQIEITDREKEILIRVADGKSTKVIADELFISTRTVETHRLNLLKKFKANNAADLIKYALKKKIISI